jgi:hypothetical protein
MGELRSQKQQGEQLVGSLRAAGKSWVEIAEVLGQRYRFNARVALRYAHGWGQSQAADEWNKRWFDEMKTCKMFSYWEQWPSRASASTTPLPPGSGPIVPMTCGCAPIPLTWPRELMPLMDSGTPV